MELVWNRDYSIKNNVVSVKVAFTPDEEIGQGVKYFNTEKFGCDFGYTMDGGAIGELEYENFNAASACIKIQGRNIHPGYAKNKDNGHVLKQSERKAFEQQWLQLCNEKEVLRIWENNEIMSVPENYYDEYIINTVKNFHQKQKNTDFIKSARIIGEVIGVRLAGCPPVCIYTDDYDSSCNIYDCLF